MRVTNSLRNSATITVQMFISMLFSFIVRTVFIRILGIQYQGLNGLFSNILSMLSIAELGIGTAIVFNMYRYIAAKDIETMKSLMHFYRNCYRIVAGVITLLGFILIPFLHFFSSYQGIDENVTVIYLLFLANTVATYLFSYKRSILYANQKNYIISLYDLGYTVVVNVAYLIVLLVFRNFILYLLCTLVFSIIENLLINHVANQRYPWLKEKKVRKLDRVIIQGFRKQIYGMLYHNIGYFVVMGTDSLIITKFLGLVQMGLYSNYLLITNSLGNIFGTALGGATASIGDLLTEKNPKKSFAAYRNISFANFWIYCFSSISIFVVMRPFITIWLGKNYLLSTTVLLVMVLNFYVQGMRKPISLFQSASGIFYENRHVPIIEAIVNFVASIILVQVFGLEGVLMGTLLSTMILYGYSFPKYIYVPVFERKNSDYVWEQIRYFLIFLLILLISAIFSYSLLWVKNNWLVFFLSLVISLFVPNFLLFVFFRKVKEFMYFKQLLRRMLRR